MPSARQARPGRRRHRRPGAERARPARRELPPAPDPAGGRLACPSACTQPTRASSPAPSVPASAAEAAAAQPESSAQCGSSARAGRRGHQARRRSAAAGPAPTGARAARSACRPRPPGEPSGPASAARPRPPGRRRSSAPRTTRSRRAWSARPRGQCRRRSPDQGTPGRAAASRARRPPWSTGTPRRARRRAAPSCRPCRTSRSPSPSRPAACGRSPPPPTAMTGDAAGTLNPANSWPMPMAAAAASRPHTAPHHRGNPVLEVMQVWSVAIRKRYAEPRSRPHRITRPRYPVWFNAHPFGPLAFCLRAEYPDISEYRMPDRDVNAGGAADPAAVSRPRRRPSASATR